MSVTYNTALTNRQANSAATTFDSGGTLEIYSGTQPASANDSPAGDLLCTISLPADPFTAATDGVCALQGSWSGTASDTGTAGWGRFTSADTTLVMDGTVDEDFTLGTSAVVNGNPVTVTVCTLSQVAGE
jgi:hypothetical protein